MCELPWKPGEGSLQGFAFGCGLLSRRLFVSSNQTRATLPPFKAEQMAHMQEKKKEETMTEQKAAEANAVGFSWIY